LTRTTAPTTALEKIAVFDDELIARNLRPGGSADLLIVTAFPIKFSNGIGRESMDDALALWRKSSDWLFDSSGEKGCRSQSPLRMLTKATTGQVMLVPS
jgi:hypothetical protein